MKAVIIGGSVAGSAMALALSRFCKVTVYDERKKAEISEKICGNICTYSIERYAHALGIKEDFTLSRYNNINIFSKGNRASFPTREYEIGRKKLLSEMMKNALKNGAEFNFSTKFLDIRRINGAKKHYEVFFEKNGKRFSDKADVVIGADGAVSEVAKKIGRKNKEFFLFLQTTVKRSQIGKEYLIPDKNSYSIFVGRNFGFYSYIFPSKNGNEFKIGLGDDFRKDVSEEFRLFLEYLGIKKSKFKGALIPKPGLISGSGGVYLIGDASCNVKYTGGGIVPIMEQVIALRDKILSGKDKKMRILKRKMLLNRMFTKFIERMKDSDFDFTLDVLKDPRLRNAFSSRDDVGSGELRKFLSPRLMLFASKVMLS